MKLAQLFKFSDVQLKEALVSELIRRGYSDECMYNTKDFLYAEGDAPYMLIAHLDTVHKKLPTVICYSRDGNYIMSPQGIGGDDRCGVYIILSVLSQLSFKPYILFTMGEEVGCVGAKAFVDFLCDNPYNIPELKYIVEYDRKGSKDCVFYQCDNKDFNKFVESFGFKTAYGSCSDISKIAPELGVAAVNLSSGYYNPHTEHEYVCVKDMHNTIAASVKMLNTECEQFEYIEKPVVKVTPQYGSQARNTSFYRQLSVTVLPAGSVNIKMTYYSGSVFENMDNEIAIDAQGNYYRYFHTYKDWERVYNITPIDANNPPKYNGKKSRMISVYNYSYGYGYDYD